MKKIRRRASPCRPEGFHGTSGRIGIGYKELFINGEKAPQTDRQDEGNDNKDFLLMLPNNSNHSESSYQVLQNFLI